MKKLQYILLTVSVVFFTACGGGGGGSYSVPVPQQPTPQPTATANISYELTNSSVKFTAVVTNNTNPILSYSWKIGSNTYNTPSVSMTTYNAGIYLAILTVTDSEGNTFNTSRTITFQYGSDGYDIAGYDRDGYDRNGYNNNGYDRNGFDSTGYDSNGLDITGYDVNGYDIDGYDIDKFDINGIAKTEIINGINYTQGTRSTIPTTIKTAEYYASNYMEVIKASEAYSRGWTGEGVTVAVIDSGIDSDHTDLDDNLIGTFSTISDGSTEDIFGHGTHVAGIIAAERNGEGMHGLAYNAKLISIKAVLDNGTAFYSDIGKAAVLASQQGAKVANTSVTGTLWYTQYFGGIVDDFRTALDADTSLVFSAGNASTDDPGYPAALPAFTEYADLLTRDGAFFSVGAVDMDGNLASYSNKAGIAKDWHIMAPGGDIDWSNYQSTDSIYSTYLDNQYTTMNGTSMAAPIITASVAIMAQRFPYLKGSEIQDIMFATTTDLGEAGVDAVYGHGLLNFEKAMAPIGDIVIPTGASVASTNLEYQATTSSIAASTAFGDALKIASMENTMILDDFNRDYKINMTNNVAMTNQAFNMDQLNEIELDKGFTFGMQTQPHNNIFSFGRRLLDGTRIRYAHSDTLFGTSGNGAMMINGSTHYLAVTIPLNLNWSAGLSYGLGEGSVGGLFKDISTVQGLGANVKYSKDSFNIGIKMPMKVISGTISSSIPISRDMEGNIEYTDITSSMKPKGTQIDVYSDYTVPTSKTSAIKFTTNYSKDAMNIQGINNYNVSFNYVNNF